MDFSGSDARQEAFFLLRRAVSHQRQSHGADGDERQRCTGDVGLLEEDQLLGGAVALSAVLLWPPYRQPS